MIGILVTPQILRNFHSVAHLNEISRNFILLINAKLGLSLWVILLNGSKTDYLVGIHFIEQTGVYDFEFDKSDINHSNWFTVRMFQKSSNKGTMSLNEIKRMKLYRTDITYSTTSTLADFYISTRCETVLKLTMHFGCICNTFKDDLDILDQVWQTRSSKIVYLAVFKIHFFG